MSDLLAFFLSIPAIGLEGHLGLDDVLTLIKACFSLHVLLDGMSD